MNHHAMDGKVNADFQVKNTQNKESWASPIPLEAGNYGIAAGESSCWQAVQRAKYK